MEIYAIYVGPTVLLTHSTSLAVPLLDDVHSSEALTYEILASSN
jgi:hypothetical protein